MEKHRWEQGEPGGTHQSWRVLGFRVCGGGFTVLRVVGLPLLFNTGLGEVHSRMCCMQCRALLDLFLLLGMHAYYVIHAYSISLRAGPCSARIIVIAMVEHRGRHMAGCLQEEGRGDDPRLSGLQDLRDAGL